MVVSESTQGFTQQSFPIYNAPQFGIQKSEPFFGDIGYSNPIPWPLVKTVGWWTAGTIPEEKALILRADPEYYAVNNLIRTNAGLATIDVNDPIYQFEREDYTIPIGYGGRKGKAKK